MRAVPTCRSRLDCPSPGLSVSESPPLFHSLFPPPFSFPPHHHQQQQQPSRGSERQRRRRRPPTRRTTAWENRRRGEPPARIRKDEPMRRKRWETFLVRDEEMRDDIVNPFGGDRGALRRVSPQTSHVPSQSETITQYEGEAHSRRSNRRGFGAQKTNFGRQDKVVIIVSPKRTHALLRPRPPSNLQPMRALTFRHMISLLYSSLSQMFLFSSTSNSQFSPRIC